jgi:transposase
MLIKCTQDAKLTGISLEGFYQSISIYAQNLRHINDQIKKVDALVKELSLNIESVSLLNSIPGIGKRLAPIIASEIGDISRFKNAKQLVAYCGIDPSVRQSGNFTGSNNKFTKRGSYYLRKALYIAAAVSISTNSNGSYVNKILYDYYQKKIQSKAKKQALGAIMNKIVHIIFSVLQNKRKFVPITPEDQVKLYKNSIRVVA